MARTIETAAFGLMVLAGAAMLVGLVPAIVVNVAWLWAALLAAVRTSLSAAVVALAAYAYDPH